ncbi:choline-binding protein [Clostridium saccharoperbutylacetonicum]
MKIFKKLCICTMVSMTILGTIQVGANAEWKQNSTGWWYSQNNSYAVGWRQLDGKWYYFDAVGYMKTGWVAINGSWYYFKSTGEMVADGIIDGFALGKDGKMISPDYYKTQVKGAEDQAISNAMNNTQVVQIEDVKKSDDSSKVSTEDVIKNIENYQKQSKK